MTEVPRLERDLPDLIKLTTSKQPRKILTRVKDRATSRYLLGYDIQSGFGTGLFAKGRLIFESEVWARYEQEKTSNWRESENLTLILE